MFEVDDEVTIYYSNGKNQIGWIKGQDIDPEYYKVLPDKGIYETHHKDKLKCNTEQFHKNLARKFAKIKE
jgi:hypothetical protein